jgi:hypothetical protein
LALTGSENCRPAGRLVVCRATFRFGVIAAARVWSGLEAKSARQPPTLVTRSAGSPRNENVAPDGTLPERRSTEVVVPGYRSGGAPWSTGTSCERSSESTNDAGTAKLASSS